MNDRLSSGILLVLVFAVLTAWITEPWASYLLYAIVFVLGIAWSIGCLLHPIPARPDPLVWFLCAIPALGLIQLGLGVTVNRWQTLNAVLLWMANAVLFFLSTQLFNDSARRDRFLNRLLWLGVAVAVVAVFQLHTSHGKVLWVFQTPFTGFIMGPFPYHNHFAGFMALVLPFALYMAQMDRRRQWSHAVLAAILAGAVLASASRSGTILIGLEVTAFVILGFRRIAPSNAGRIGRVAILAGLIALSGAITGWNSLWGRFEQSDPVRIKLAQSSLEMIRSAPWRGSGLGTWSSAYPMHAQFDDGRFVNQAHSDWLQWTAEGGLPLLAILLYIAATLTVPASRYVWGLGVPAIFAQCLADYPLQKPAISATVFVIAGALRAASARRNKQHPPATDFGVSNTEALRRRITRAT
jgi:O-antigen ligase